ncbi:MAG: hypothetical protein NTX52_07020, partial [Planctomycetota bacterium]|nr:hypothetical protein [Planctomycetota bacterium]
IENATIKAKEFRIRLQFEGAIADLKLPPKVEIGRPIHISSGKVHPVRKTTSSSNGVNVDFQIAHAAFDSYPITTGVGRDSNTAWLDIIFYSGPQRTVDFRRLNEAAFIFALSVNPLAENRDPTHFSDLTINRKDNLVSANWNRPSNSQMSLTIPVKPDSSSKQRTNSSAKIGQQNPWKKPKHSANSTF